MSLITDKIDDIARIDTVEQQSIDLSRGYKNYIINGGFDIWERGTSSTSDGYTTADRFFITGGMTRSMSGLAPNGFSNSLLIGASSSGYSVRQGIELKQGHAGIYYNGNTVTYSFRVRGQAGTVLGVNAIFRNTVAGVADAVNAHINSSAYTIQSSLVWETVEYTFTISGTINANNELLEMNIYSSSTSEIRITGIQLEEGSVATPFEQKPYGLELSLCQRYYQVGGGIAVGGVTQAGYAIYRNVYFPVTMRETPTVVFSAGGYFGSATSETITARKDHIRISSNGFAANNSIGIIGHGTPASYTADAEL